VYKPFVEGSCLQQWSRPSSDVLQQGFSKQNTISNEEGVASMAGRCGEESVGDKDKRLRDDNIRQSIGKNGCP
jgi:hypothetical protein